jgi:hypothetical protein
LTNSKTSSRKKSDVPSTQNGGELSLAMPDQMVDHMARSSMGPTSSNNAISMGPSDPTAWPTTNRRGWKNPGKQN